jgi:hypothetical protein
MEKKMRKGTFWNHSTFESMPDLLAVQIIMALLLKITFTRFCKDHHVLCQYQQIINYGIT